MLYRTHTCLLHTNTPFNGIGLKEAREQKSSLDADSDAEIQLLAHRVRRRQSTPMEVIEVVTSRGNSPTSVTSQEDSDQHISTPRRCSEEAPVLSNDQNGG